MAIAQLLAVLGGMQPSLAILVLQVHLVATVSQVEVPPIPIIAQLIIILGAKPLKEKKMLKIWLRWTLMRFSDPVEEDAYDFLPFISQKY